jgi:hypothetical protein
MRLRIAMASIAALASGGALAQDSAVADDPDAALQERALTRPLVDPPPIGAAARAVAGEIDWIGMRTELALTQRREVAARQSIAGAAQRPPGLRAAAPDRFKNVVVREVNLTRLPVLAPEGARIAATLKVYSLGDSYSATAEVEDGVSMRMSGTRKSIVVGDQKNARARIAAMREERKILASLDAPYLITRSDSSTDLSFAKFGAGYVLSLMCDDPADPRCAADDSIVALASHLILLNPEAGGE